MSDSSAGPCLQDFYQPESIVPISIPGSYYAITLAKVAAGYWCSVGNRCVFGATCLDDKLTPLVTDRAGNLIGWYVDLSRRLVRLQSTTIAD